MPQHTTARTAASEAEGKAPLETLETVLIAEDEPTLRTIFRRVLQDHGYFVLVASNGAEAVSLAQQFRYPIHLLIADLSMPKMGGSELARRMAAVHPETEVLFVSGYCTEPVAEISPKAHAVLHKPFKPDDLLSKVRDVLQHAAIGLP